jgi:hypothetical protein
MADLEGAATHCSVCMTPNRAGARFCASCGSGLHQASKNCPSCGKQNAPNAHFCRDCGASIVNDGRACLSCGAQNSKKAIFCRNCAARLEAPIESNTALPSDQGDHDGTTIDRSVSNLAIDADSVDHKADDAEDLTSFLSKDETLQSSVPRSQIILQRWLGQIRILAKERPYMAISTTIVAFALMAGLVTAIVWTRQEAPSANSGATQNSGKSSGALYAVRLAHIRNAPTSIGTAVIGDLQAGQEISGVWILGRDGVTEWLHIKRGDGSDGFIWGRNLSRIRSFGDPAAYCQAVRDDDDPTRSITYQGPAVTDRMLAVLQATATGATKDLTVWRCASGRILACAEFGTTSCEKAPWLTVHAVPASLRNICHDTPNAGCAGATHCIYGCRNGTTVVNQNSYPVDERGFAPKEWITISGM